MTVQIYSTVEQMGVAAAARGAEKIREAIAARGQANIIIATGASQFSMLQNLIKAPGLDWTKVTMFHLDEYVGVEESHPASFRKYIKERFVANLPAPLKAAYYVNGSNPNPQQACDELGKIIARHPIDVCFIGIGENGHIAFNDPPADFETKESFRIVHLDDRCRHQQLREGWFPDLDAVPRVAVSMTPYRIMQCGCIVSSVPHSEKAEAVYRTLSAEKTTNLIPATLLRAHGDWHLFLDQDSASLCGEDVLAQYR